MKKILVFSIIALILASCAPTAQLSPQSGPGNNATPAAGSNIPSTGGMSPSATPLPTSNNPGTGGTLPSATPAVGSNSPSVTVTPAPAGKSGIPNFDHIVLIMLENRDYSNVIGSSSQMPLLNTLATQNVLLSDYFGVSHPSLPNYIALMSGSTQDITSDCTNCFVNRPNLADEIETSGRTWKAYLESMPSPCFVGDAAPYAQKHNPLIYFNSIRLNFARCERSIVPLNSLESDLSGNRLPNFAYIMPNLCNSGHDCSAATADKWVSDMVAKLQASPALGNNSLIIVAFDEASDKDKTGCCGISTPAGGHVAAVLISPTALPDMSDNTAYSHYSLLKTILTAWNLPALGATAMASTQPITAPWTGLATQPNSDNTASVPVPTDTASSAVLTAVQSDGCSTSSPASGAYIAKICFSSPANTSTVSGNATVTVTVSVTGTNPGVKRMVFRLGSAYLLTDYSNPYTFVLPTAKWADGSYTLFAYALMRDGFSTGKAEEQVDFSNGNATAPVNDGTFTPATGTVPPSGGPFLVAAAGDGASGEPASTSVVNLVKSLNPNLFLYLGDVYESGSKAEFYNWYGTSGSNFSALRAITDPTIGNHEYNDGANGASYFDYWNNVPNYYSFNAGGWHFISLNANSGKIDVSPAGAQYAWLQQDLSSNTLPCTIAFYHQPLFNIGAEVPQKAMADMWALLAKYGVSIVLNGHDHDYQRWVPLDGNGNPAPNGITEFVAGGAGHGLQKISKTDPRVAASYYFNPTAFGVLLLQLGQNGANFSYHSTSGAVLDSGFISCKTAQ